MCLYQVRSKIARGACGQPKAGCMGPVVWDDELARVAQKWADQCANVDYKVSQGTILTVEDFCGKWASLK